MNWSELIGKKIVAFRGWKAKRTNHGKDQCPLSRILFDDGETFLSLEEQDYYTYHDCSSIARVVTLTKDEKQWKSMSDKEGKWDEPDDTVSPF